MSDLEVCTIELEEAYDAVLTTNSGFPLDQNLYQSVKGIYTASLVVKKGAPIILASKCGAGIGSENFYSLSKNNKSPQEVLDYIEANGPIVAQWQNQVLCDVLKHHEVYVKSSLKDRDLREMNLNPVDDLQKFLPVVIVA